jgi:tetratricopeptide (TPR) repeat protein/DNA-binding CsgD family transcriptional regulator
MTFPSPNTIICRWRILAALLLITLCCETAQAGKQYHMDSLLQVLDAVIDSSAIYDAHLHQDLVGYRVAFDNAEDDKTRFVKAHILFKTYRKFRLDSALYFARQRVQIAHRLNIPDSLLSARLDEADALKCLGRLNDAMAVLDAIPHNAYISNSPHYYSLYLSILLSLSQMTTDNLEEAHYKSLLMHYRDTLNLVNSLDTLTVCVNTCAIDKSHGRFKEALEGLRRFGEIHGDLVCNSAIYWYELADTYRNLGDMENAKYCFTMSSIIDKRNCSKTYTSLQSLAWLLYQEGDTERAFRYINCSLNDVMSSNARNRLSLVGEYLPIITTAYTHHQHTLALRRNILIGICALALAILAGLLSVIYRSNKRMKAMQAQLKDNNNKLQQLNNQLREQGKALIESNRIKEEYIGQLFNLCSQYISESENKRTKILGRIKMGKVKELQEQLSSSTMAQDLNRLFDNFDAIFLELFPDFIERFNELLRPDEQIEVKGKHLLTPELRIYALVRLGINDSTKIAGFLHYSPQTVYNYRMKVRNKSDLTKDQFIAKIQSL